MRDADKAQEELINELVEMRQRIVELEASAAERKQAEKALKEAEWEKAAILDNMSELVVYHDLEMKVLWANRAAGESVGLTPEQLVGRHCYEIWPQRSKPCAGCPVKRVLKSGQPQEAEMTTPDGRMWFIRGHPVRGPNGEMVGIVEVTLEITERKRAEEMLRESEERYRVLAENSPIGIFISDAERFIYTNQRLCEITGFSRDELLNMPDPVGSLFAPGERELVKSYALSRLSGGPAPTSYEARGIRKNGEEVSLKLTTSSIVLLGRRVLQGVVEDITERKRAEEMLRESEEKFRNLAEQSPNMIFINKKGRIVYANKKCEEVMGYSREEFYSPDFDFLTLIAPEYVDLITANMTRHMRGEEVPPYEYALITKEGKRIETILAPKLIRYGGEIAILGTITDITERKRLEERLRRSQKMEAVGRLAGGVAHDFNNLLTAITGYSDLLLRDLDDHDPLRQDVEQIMKAGERAASLTRQLLAFSRGQALQPQVLDLNATVADMGKMLRRLIGEDIDLVTVLDPELERVKADPSRIGQVIVNLAVNARDAMPQGGRLTIKTENVTLDKACCQVLPEARPGKFVCLSVEDTGVGIDEEISQHIFEPFFSTKGEEGIGLGLAVVYGIVRQHGGWINVYSEPGQGSTFKVYLLAFSLESEEDGTEEVISLQGFKGRGERLLVVEDDPGVRELARRALGENGYVVFEATSAADALDIFEREKGHFHLVFSDVVLPDQTGLQLVDHFLARKPALKVLLSSGYADRKSQWPLICERGFHFLEKPYTLSALLRAVREAIEPGHNETRIAPSDEEVIIL